MNPTRERKSVEHGTAGRGWMRAGTLAVWAGWLSAAWGQSAAAPELLYSSAKAGPNQGWEGSANRGAAISIWGRNFGSTRGSSFLTVAGVALTSDSDYAEWGATTNPTTAKNLQRITFWLNSSMVTGNATGMSVTVNGVASDVLPFTIDNSSVVRFIDGTNGNDSWDGQYKDHSLGGTHGPWKTAFMYTQRAGTGPGTFFYMRGGTYTSIFDPSSGHPALAYIGYFEQGTTSCNIYYPQINGTDALRYTVTSYPGELAVFNNVIMANKSNYWTFANFRWTNVSDDAYDMGDQWAMCATCQMRSVGLDMIGMQFDGAIHHVVHTFGNDFRLLANYINVVPVGGSGYDATTAYPLYLSAGDNLLVKDNEIHGGGMYSIHNYDEPRCSGAEVGRSMNNTTFDSNLLDLTRNATNPVDMRAGILTGINIPGNSYNNTVIKNNIIYSQDNLASEAGVKLFSETPTTLNGIHIYNNTVHNVPWGLEVIYNTTDHYQNVDLVNNIFNQIGQDEIYIDGGAAVDVNPVFQNNLVNQAPRVNGNATVSANVIGQPQFVNAPTDFHLQSTSPAIRAGLSLPAVTLDYDSNARPQGAAYDLGALQFATSSGSNPPPPTISISVTPSTVNLNGGQSQQFSATVTGSSNTAASWSLTPQVGTLTAAGFYTAPSSISAQQAVQIKATSVADGTKFAIATVNLMPPAAPAVAISVAISPATTSLGSSQSQQFTATVTGTTNTAVTWSLSPQTGTLSAAGLYTAPASITSQQTVQIKAASAADSTKFAAAMVTLNPPVSAPSTSTYNVAWTMVSPTQASVSWSAPAGHSPYDAIWLTGYGAPSWWYAAQSVTGNVNSGTFVFDLPTAPGIYQFRYVSSQNNQVQARSADLPIGVSQFSLSVTPTVRVARSQLSIISTPTAGSGAMTVSWTAPSGRPQTWADTIVLYRLGTPDLPVWSQYTMGATSGSFIVPVPVKAGTYEFRYVMDYLVGARSASITVK